MRSGVDPEKRRQSKKSIPGLQRCCSPSDWQRADEVRILDRGNEQRFSIDNEGWLPMARNTSARQLFRDGKRVTVCLPPEVYAALIVLKLRRGVSLESLVREACARFTAPASNP